MEKKLSDKEQGMKDLNVDNSQKQFELDRMKAKIFQLQLEITNISQEKTTLLAQFEESKRKYKQDLFVSSSKDVQLKEVNTKMETYRFELH